MFKLQAIFHDCSVGMEFMTDDSSEAAEMRGLWLAFDCVVEVLLSDEPAWVSLQPKSPMASGRADAPWQQAYRIPVNDLDEFNRHTAFATGLDSGLPNLPKRVESFPDRGPFRVFQVRGSRCATSAM
jgi:hypothetical protein